MAQAGYVVGLFSSERPITEFVAVVTPFLDMLAVLLGELEDVERPVPDQNDQQEEP